MQIVSHFQHLYKEDTELGEVQGFYRLSTWLSRTRQSDLFVPRMSVGFSF